MEKKKKKFFGPSPIRNTFLNCSLPIWSVACDCGISAQNRMKSHLTDSNLQSLMRILVEGQVCGTLIMLKLLENVGTTEWLENTEQQVWKSLHLHRCVQILHIGWWRFVGAWWKAEDTTGNIGMQSMHELFCSCQRGKDMVIVWMCKYEGTLLWSCFLEQCWAFEKYWFLDRVHLRSGAVSDIMEPCSQGFSRFEGDQSSSFESASGVYISGCVHVIDQKSVVVFSK